MISYSIFLLAFILQLTLLAQATDLLGGHTGRIGLSAPVFAGIAGYSYALSTTQHQANPWIAVLISLAITSVISSGIGFLLLRLDAEGFLMATFAIQVAFVDLMRNVKFTGGPLGIRNIPAPSISGFSRDATVGSLFILIPMLALVLVSVTIVLEPRSPLGRAYHWIRDDSESAIAFGIRTERLLLSAFTIHALIAGVAGIGLVVAQAYIGPNSFDLWLSLSVLAIVFLTGTGSSPSLMLLGATVFVCLIEVVNLIIASPQLVGASQQIIFNALLVLILIFRRRGIAGPILESGPSAARAE